MLKHIATIQTKMEMSDKPVTPTILPESSLTGNAPIREGYWINNNYTSRILPLSPIFVYDTCAPNNLSNTIKLADITKSR